MTTEEAWKTYNFINAYKAGDFGIIPLQDAIERYYDDFDAVKHEKKFGKRYM